MKRRAFLSQATLGTAAAVAATIWPAWLRAAFAGPCDTRDEDELAVVSAAYRRAQRAGKPLLCIIIPKDPADHWERGQALGELLNHGTNAQLAPLSLCEVVCTSLGALRRLVPDAGQGTEPVFVLCETAGDLATRSLDAPLPRDQRTMEPQLEALAEKDWRKYQAEVERRENQMIDRRIAVLAALYEAPLWGADVLQRRAEQAAAARPVEASFVLKALGGKRPLSPAQADEASAVVAQHSRRAGQMERATALLSGAVRARLVARRVPGSHWARGGGCGVQIEGVPEDEQLLVACGMGHVPAKSARFLEFYVRTPAQKRAQEACERAAGTGR